MYLAQFLAMTGNPRDALHKMQHSFQGAQSATGYIDLVPWEDLFHSEWLVPVRELPEWPDWSNEVRGWLTRPGIAQG
jgi:hypothetical protein